MNDTKRVKSLQAKDILVAQDNSSLSGIHLAENNEDPSEDDNIPMDIQYDIESMQILDIPLGQEPNECEDQLEQQLNPSNSENESLLQPLDQDGRGRYCAVTASPPSCEAIIDEICQEEVLDSVLYVQDGELLDDPNSPIVVCFAASPNNISGKFPFLGS